MVQPIKHGRVDDVDLGALTRDKMLEMPAPERRRVVEKLGREGARKLRWNWHFWRRRSQAAPLGDWRFWLLLAGRGFGKTRTAAEFIRERVEQGAARRIALVAKTPADARDVMITGQSGLLSISPPWFRPKYEPSLRRLTWPNGAIATVYSSAEPDQLRGPEHDLAWCDEPAAWKYPDDTFSNLDFGLRISPPMGGVPQAVLSTTPRPIKLIRSLVAEPRHVTALTQGTSYENEENLDATFFARMLATYEDTRIGRQELLAEILDDVEGALWTSATLDAGRVVDYPDLPNLVVAVDPAISAHAASAETGIIVAAVGADGHGYVLEDLSCRMSPEGWAQRVKAAYDDWGADAVVAEVNQGGDMVEAVLKSADPNIVVRKVRATRGKYTRAEPIAALYERGRVHHVGRFARLEHQLTHFTGEIGEESPDRLDALVWAITALMLDEVTLLAVGFA